VGRRLRRGSIERGVLVVRSERYGAATIPRMVRSETVAAKFELYKSSNGEFR